MDGSNHQRRVDLQKEIILTESQKQILTKQAEEQKPNEACSILFGKIEEGKTIVEEVFVAENIESSPVNFTISNEQLLEVYKKAEEKNTEIVAIFHSHPDSEAYPSQTDQKFMQVNPVTWIIYSGITKDLKAFNLESDVNEIPIMVS